MRLGQRAFGQAVDPIGIVLSLQHTALAVDLVQFRIADHGSSDRMVLRHVVCLADAQQAFTFGQAFGDLGHQLLGHAHPLGRFLLLIAHLILLLLSLHRRLRILRCRSSCLRVLGLI